MRFASTFLKTPLPCFGTVLLCFAFASSIRSAEDFPAPPNLAVSRQSKSLDIHIQGTPGCSYTLEISQTLQRWSTGAQNSSDDGQFIVTRPGTVPKEFVRAFSLLSTQPTNGTWIFDGRSFQGWNGDTQTVFRVEKCALVGGSLTRTFDHNEFLCTDRLYTNFLLQLKFKLAGAGQGFVNSGVQFRSRRVPGSPAVSGYQADIGAGFWGGLYDEGRRGTFLSLPNQADLEGYVRTNDWNNYEIRAENRRIQISLNGYMVTDYSEPDRNIPQDGVIGLQVHAGGPAEASFKDILLIELP